MNHSFLHIRGTIDEAMVYHARPGHESPRPGSRREGDPDYVLVLLDAHGSPLVSVHPRVARVGCGHPNDAFRASVRGVLPLHPEGRAYELRNGDIVLYRQPLGDAPPAPVEVREKRDGAVVALRWKPVTDKRALTYSVVIEMATGRRLTLGRHLQGDTFTVDLATLPQSGAGSVFLVADDGVRSSATAVTEVRVPERAPTVHILEPQDDFVLSFAQPLSMVGCCLGMDGSPVDTASSQWSLDGAPVAQDSLLASVAVPTPGRHQLTLRVETGQDTKADASVTFEVEAPDREFQARKALVDALVVDHAPR